MFWVSQNTIMLIISKFLLSYPGVFLRIQKSHINSSSTHCALDFLCYEYRIWILNHSMHNWITSRSLRKVTFSLQVSIQHPQMWMVNCCINLIYRVLLCKVQGSCASLYLNSTSGIHTSLLHRKKTNFFILLLHMQSLPPIHRKNEAHGLAWQGCVADSSKTSPRILIFSIVIGVDTVLLF